MLLENSVTFEEFVKMLDESYDEIFIWDKNHKIIYVNNACIRHYGLPAQYFVGKTLEECIVHEKLWSPTCVPLTFDEKRSFIQREKSLLGIDMLTISSPILDDEGNVKYVFQSVRDDEEDLFKMLSPRILKSAQEETGMDVKIIGKSPAMIKTLNFADKIAATKAPVLILGETGTGKSLLAKYIHEKSPRRNKPFVSINIASLSPTVIESELFGYQKGAFTGAEKNGKVGLFEAANGGTLFLDEIGELPYDLQAKFLHTLQEETITPVGSHTPIKLDIHIISATNCDLRTMIEAGKFREDLYHRLNVFDIMIPPLRKRQEDIELLTAYYLNLLNKKYERNVTISSRVMDSFKSYPWKGNIRELSNVLERAILMTDGSTIEVANLPESFFHVGNIKMTGCAIDSEKISFDEAMERYENHIIKEAYNVCKSSRKMAEYLQISQTKANRLIQKHITHANHTE